MVEKGAKVVDMLQMKSNNKNFIKIVPPETKTGLNALNGKDIPPCR